MTLSNKKEKRLQTLMRKLSFIDKVTMDGMPEWPHYRTLRTKTFTRADYYEVYYLADLKGWSADTLKVEWIKAQRVQWHIRRSYKEMPRSPKQDNKNVRVGGGGSNRNSIRFPKAVRKTAWKRFWKLFPALEGCYNMDDYRKKCNDNPETKYPLYQTQK